MKHLIIGTAGHVDHGKTALIKALTGTDCDTHKQEKERGITINLGFAHLELSETLSCGIVDVPGHKDFIKTMVAGVHGIDMAMLVIAADSGIMPQTREHLNILSMLGIKHILIVINKSDLVDADMLEMAKLETMDFVEGTIYENAPIVAVSALDGEGMGELRQAMASLADGIRSRSSGNVFRMYIDRIFNLRGVGIVLTGSVLDGHTGQGSELFLLPGRHPKVKVKGIERHGKAVQEVSAGDRAALNLSGIKLEAFEQGMLLTDQWLEETSMIDASLTLFEGKTRLGLWSHHHFHTGTFSSPAKVHLLNADEITGGGKALVQIHLEKPALLILRDRFVLRNSSGEITLGGGMVIDPYPLHHRRRNKKLVGQIESLSSALEKEENAKDLLLLELEKANEPLSLTLLAKKTGKTEKDIRQAAKSAPKQIHPFTYRDEDYLVSEVLNQSLAGKLQHVMEQWHKANPLNADGLHAREIAGKLKIGQQDPKRYLIKRTLEQWVEKGKLKSSNDNYALKGHTAEADPKSGARQQQLEEIIRKAGMERNTKKELEAQFKVLQIKTAEMDFLLRELSKKGSIYYNGVDLVHASLVNSSRKKLLEKLMNSPRGMNEKEFRLLIDGTKRFVQLLIKIFEQEGIIERKTFYLHITEKGKSLITSGKLPGLQ